MLMKMGDFPKFHNKKEHLMEEAALRATNVLGLDLQIKME